MKRVYVAGAMTPTGTGSHAIEFLENLRRGMRGAVDVIIQMGASPYCPMTDFAYWLVLREGEVIEPKTIYAVSMAFLEVCNVVYVLPGSEDSIGSQKEILRAEELGIPVCYSLAELDYILHPENYHNCSSCGTITVL